jgi:integrase
MVLLAVTTGLRRSELFALKWRDLDFPSLTLRIRRSIYKRTIGKCKSITSRKDLPLSRYVADELMYWQQQSKYKEANDWVFASPRMQGRYPYWPAMLLTRTIRPQHLQPALRNALVGTLFVTPTRPCSSPMVRT